MTEENEELTRLKGIGQKRAELFAKTGIFTVGDLLYSFPRDYTDYSCPTPISGLEPGSAEPAVFCGRVTKKLSPYISPRVSVYKLIVDDGTGAILITIFNSSYAFDSFVTGQEYCFCGKIKGSVLALECQSPTFTPKNSGNLLVPKYHLTGGLTVNVVIQAVRNALSSCELPEILPEDIIKEYSLVPRKEAVTLVHFPPDREQLERGRRTLAFTELLTLRLGMLIIRHKKKDKCGLVMQPKDIEEFYSTLSFSPTNAQKRAVAECIADMTGGSPMNRLLQGDVGSGKTLVAAALCWFAAKNGFQCALMAPTEILAFQHYDSLSSLLGSFGINVVLLTGSRAKKAALNALSDGSAQVAVGTHALIQSSVEFPRLALVITDEQHRFGVKQRTELTSKGSSVHTLVMSATPIPRTLALSVYGDLDVSVLDEMPRGRLPIKTYGVNSGFRERIYKFIIKYINDGFQAYIVCPLIEDGDDPSKESAVKYFEKLKARWFSDIPIALLHGRMKQAEKDSIMSGFKNGEYKLLVATTVIEVGIDVPNAVIMVIENAEQFGLSQLHQLRGRVGRGSEQSFCILITDSDSEYTKARVDTMVNISDGFGIAEEDLRLRGPGSFFGARQHGLPELRISDMSSDIMLIHTTAALADKIIADDPKLTAPGHAGLRAAVAKLFSERNNYGAN